MNKYYKKESDIKYAIMKSQLFILLIASFASAELVKIEFSGILTRVDQGSIMGHEVTPGMIFHGTYLYQDTAQDSNPESSEYGIYEFTVPYSQYIVSVGDFTFSAESYKVAVLNRDESAMDITSFQGL